MGKYPAIEYIAKNRIIEGLMRDYSVDLQYRDDLLQEIYLILLDYDQQKLLDIIEKKQIRFFTARILRNQFYSKTSAFYRKYKKPVLNKETLQPIIDNENAEGEESFD